MNNYKTQNFDVHSTAIIDPSALISENVSVGSNVIIGKDVQIGKGTIIYPNVIIEDNTIIGENCKIYYGAVIGSESQDLKYKPEYFSFVIIGDNNVIREYVTINKASGDNTKTVIGNNNLFMAYSHVAHDCLIGNNNVFANSVNFGGHVTVGNNNVIGGLTGIHQFVRISSFAMIGGLTRVDQDVPPYFVTVGNPPKVEGLNIIGLKRNGFTRESILLLKKTYEIMFKQNLKGLKNIILELEKLEKTKETDYLLSFLKSSKKRGITGLFIR